MVSAPLGLSKRRQPQEKRTHITRPLEPSGGRCRSCFDLWLWLLVVEPLGAVAKQLGVHPEPRLASFGARPAERSLRFPPPCHAVAGSGEMTFRLRPPGCNSASLP